MINPMIIAVLLNIDFTADVNIKNKDIKIFVEWKELGDLWAKGRCWGLRVEGREKQIPIWI